MVCVTIKRDPKRVSRAQLIKIRNAMHQAVVDVIEVKPEDVEVVVEKLDPLNLNSGALVIEIDSGPGFHMWRIEDCSQILEDINAAIVAVVPVKLQKKGKSNVWVRIFARGASMPIGHPELKH